MKREYVEVSEKNKKLLKQEAPGLGGISLKNLMDEVVIKEYFVRKRKYHEKSRHTVK